MGVVSFPGSSSGQEDSVQAAARAWVMRLAEAPEAEAQCASWRAADPAHEQAWREVSAVWTRAQDLAGLDRADWRAEIDRLTRRPRPATWGLAAAAAGIAIAALIGAGVYLDRPDLEAATRVAQTRSLVLADGSQVTLGGRSGVAVRLRSSSRRVVLDDGQAFFEVAHDRSRPFTVIAGDAEIRVTGTKFDVRKVGDDIQVSVLEGRVEVRRRKLMPSLRPSPPDRVLTAGLMAELAPGATGFSPQERARAVPGEWRSGRLFYSEAPLSEIVADLQRYSPAAIRIEDPAVAGLKVTTAVSLDQIEPFLANLEMMLPIHARRTADGAILIEAQKTPAATS